MQLSKLIVFAETIFKFLIDIGNISADKKEQIDIRLLQGRNKLVDSDGTELNDKQDVLSEMLKKLISIS